MAAVPVLLTIGEFSRMTYLSVKALRHYHDVGLLEPVEIDPATGYRRYDTDQVPVAQAIRRFRDVGMPLAEVREVLHAPDRATRDRAILVHLDRLREQLERTQTSVASLQALLTEGPAVTGTVELRTIPGVRVLQQRADVSHDECPSWLASAFDELHRRVAAAGLAVAGADGALYSDDFFEAGVGDVVAFVPVDVAGDPDVVDLPPVTALTLLHTGPFADLDHAYAALGEVVAERGIGAPGPIREHYLTETSTEVCWPVTPGANP